MKGRLAVDSRGGSRLVLPVLACLLGAGHCLAEVSVDRPPGGGVAIHFEPGPAGPWQRVRADVPAGDLLNADGDAAGDGWPVAYQNVPRSRPECIWSRAGADREIVQAEHDGLAWKSLRNLSRRAGVDELPAVAVDPAGNRHVAWQNLLDRSRVAFTALSGGTGSCQTSVLTLTGGTEQGWRPDVGVLDGVTYVAYELGDDSDPDSIYVAVDEVRLTLDPGGLVLCGGEGTIDIARVVLVRTHRDADGTSADVRVNVEDGRLWVSWLDGDQQVAWVELVDGAFAPPESEPIDPTEPDPHDLARNRVVGL